MNARKTTQMRARPERRKNVRPSAQICAPAPKPGVLLITVATCAEAQRFDRSFVFQWAREQEPARCAYWMIQGCPHVKKGATVATSRKRCVGPKLAAQGLPFTSSPCVGKMCERVHECMNCGTVDGAYKLFTCPKCPKNWWRNGAGQRNSPN